MITIEIVLNKQTIDREVVKKLKKILRDKQPIQSEELFSLLKGNQLHLTSLFIDTLLNNYKKNQKRKV